MSRHQPTSAEAQRIRELRQKYPGLEDLVAYLVRIELERRGIPENFQAEVEEAVEEAVREQRAPPTRPPSYGSPEDF